MLWDRKRPNLWKLFWTAFWTLVALSGASVAIVSWGLRKLDAIDRSLPDPSELLTYARSGTITITAADGTILQQIGEVTHDKLDLDRTPRRLIQAFLAAEDQRFYEHDGVDYKAILRAARANWNARAWIEGGSTLTQQLARMVFLTQEMTLERKLREARLAQKIERITSKAEILEKYLNLVYLGSGAYGVADAAWVYFAKTPQELTLGEMATLAGLPAAPSDYSPKVSPRLARERRDVVLQRMVDVGYISEADANAAIARPLQLNPRLPKRLNVRLPYFTTYIQGQLSNYVSDEQIEKGGLTVETTLDPQLQAQALEVVREGVAQHGAKEGFSEAALVAIDPRNGEIRALVGGTSFEASEFNRATQALRQPGSTFKGIIYAAAIAAGFSPQDLYQDAPYVVAGYQPQNYGGGYSGWVTLQDALTQSINVVAVKVLAEVGFEPTLKVARAMGIESELGEIYPLALGAFEVTLLEMTSAYGTFANAGKHYPVHGIRRILAADGTVLFDAETDLTPAQAIDADSAAIVTAMLRQVVEGGTGRPAQLDRPVAGKTGTSDDSRDLWFIGYVPQLVVGIWLGNDDNSPTYGSSGTAARVWQMFASEALAGTAVAQFPEMPNLATRVVELEAQPEEEEAVRKARGNGNAQPQASDDEDSWGVGWRNGWSEETTAPAGSARKEIESEPEYGTPEYFERHYDLDRPESEVFSAPPEPAVEPEATIPPEKLIFSQDEENDSVKY